MTTTAAIVKQVCKHYTKSRCKTKVRCNYCNVYIHFGKNMLADCKRHLFNRHPSVYNGREFGTYDPDEKKLLQERKAKKLQLRKMVKNVKITAEETWKHFTRLKGETKARCNYCNIIIAYSDGSASNCKRHFIRKHPLIILKDPTMCDTSNIKLEEVLDEQELDAGTFINSLNPAVADDDSNVKEVQFVKNPYLSEPIRIEIQGTVSPQGNSANSGENATDANMGNADDYHELTGHNTVVETIEEEIIPTDEQFFSDDGNTRPGSPVTDNNDLNLEDYFAIQSGVEALDPIGVEGGTGRGKQSFYKKATSSAEKRNENDIKMSSAANNSRNSMTSLRNFIDTTNVGIRSSVFATNIALELENMNNRQKIIAEKLISDVLYHAKLDALTEHAMVVSRGTQFEHEF